MLDKSGIDPLTGLGNRARMEDYITSLISQVQRGIIQDFCVVYVDVNDLKSMNDQAGHNIGDRVIVDVAKKLKTGLRPYDGVFRIGGDEYVAVLTNVFLNTGASVTNRIRKQINHLCYEDSPIRNPSVAVGVISYTSTPENERTVNGLCNAADKTMYEAKMMAKNMLIAHDGINGRDIIYSDYNPLELMAIRAKLRLKRALTKAVQRYL